MLNKVKKVMFQDNGVAEEKINFILYTQHEKKKKTTLQTTSKWD